MQTISLIRQRGQITIPDSIRKRVKWAQPSSPVSISVETGEEIVIRPHTRKREDVDWYKLWKQIRIVRAFKGKGRFSAAEIIEKDRNR